MARNTNDVSDLVSDAKRIIAYATRNGIILQTEFLAITYSIEGYLATNRELTNEDKVAIVSHLNMAANAIRPVTLIDLGSRWRPFAGGRNSVGVRAALVFVAILIIALAGYYTNVYVVATEALSELTSIQSRAPADKAARLYRMYVHNRQLMADIPGEQDDLHYEPYLRAKEELLDLDADILTTQTEVFRLGARTDVLRGLQSLWKKPRPPAKTFATASPPRAKPSAPSTAVPPSAKPAGPPPPGRPAPADQALSEEDFLIQIGATNVEQLVDPINSISGNTLPFQIEKVRELVESLGTLILPTLFGMIGTIVFELRRMLNPMSPNDPVERMIVRTALGGLAGLSITFVLRPLHLFQADASHADMWVFAAAFLLGFSIDVFFSILDKMVTTLTQSISGSAKT